MFAMHPTPMVAVKDCEPLNPSTYIPYIMLLLGYLLTYVAGIHSVLAFSHPLTG